MADDTHPISEPQSHSRLRKLDHIVLRRLRCWVNSSKPSSIAQDQVLRLELGQLGFKFESREPFLSTTREAFVSAMATLKEIRGGNVLYVPLFVNFPDDLPNDHTYLVRRIYGFFGLNTFGDETSFGADPISQMQRQDLWQAAAQTQAQRLSDSHTEWITLKIVTPEEAHHRLMKWATDLIYGATPVKEALWEDLLTVLHQLEVKVDFEKIKIKETLARLAADEWQNSGRIMMKTPTDLLRMFACLQGQDVSLAKNVNLKGLKLSKPQRREIIKFLDSCPALAEDLLRYRKLWISLSKWLHPGDFVKLFPGVAKTFDDLRNNRIKSFESRVINAPASKRIETLLERPSLFLRKLSWLLKEHDPNVVVNAVLGLQKNAALLPIPLLITTFCSIKSDRNRLFINKKGQSYVLPKNTSDTPESSEENQRESSHLVVDTTPVLEALDTLILTRLQGSKNWQRVWIDPALEKLVLPFQARKQSDGLINLARGSRISVSGNVLRIFVYWHQQARRTDLDLSALKLHPDFSFAGHIGFNNYGSGSDLAHSGDIQSAPFGAAEFIDIRLAAVTDAYIVPAILRFSGEQFTALKACYAGWMHRELFGAEAQVFDAKTVANKVNVNQDGQTWIPFILDVAAQELIYVDLYSKGSRVIEGNRHFPWLAECLASFWKIKPTFGDLARWYVRANNAMFVNRDDAETTIGLTDDCTINILKLVGEGVTSFSSL